MLFPSLRRLAALLLVVPCLAQAEPTRIHDDAARKALLGRHNMTLQWLGSDYAGLASVEERDGVLYLKGRQSVRGSHDHLALDGRILEVDSRTFRFQGSLETQVSHINGGQVCRREGEFLFLIKGDRRYWRLQQMENPCAAPIVDYVDVYLRR